MYECILQYLIESDGNNLFDMLSEILLFLTLLLPEMFNKQHIM